ncbi:sugar ABC transporter substrate-binding protein [Paraburkholderia sp.]|uniref:sugar ABC transporter substrate-binding protein n=1 Tax=Paraburkholderia sp. TaxID=1926495 RepID=UPI003D6FFFD8
MNRRFASSSLLALAASLGFALASPNAFAETPKTIGLAVANLQADFFNQIKQSVVAYAKTKGVNVITVDAKGDAATQVNQIQDLLTRKIDALIYIPAGATAAGVPVRAAKSAGVPVIAVDRNAPDAPGDTFIATDSVKAAEELGDWIVKQTGGHATVAELQGQLGTTPELAREKGFTAAISKAPGIKVVARQPAEWAQDKGFAVAQDMLQKNPDINVIFGHADAMALGAAQAVKIANVGHKVLIAGFDGDTAGLKAVRDGVIAVTMTQQTQLMGRMAVDSALDLLAGKKIPAEQLLPATLTTKANVGPFIANHP